MGTGSDLAEVSIFMHNEECVTLSMLSEEEHYDNDDYAPDLRDAWRPLNDKVSI